MAAAENPSQPARWRGRRLCTCVVPHQGVTRVGWFCAFAGVYIQETGSILFERNIADYIETVHADDFGAAIGQIAMCEQGAPHASSSPSAENRNIFDSLPKRGL